VIPVGYEFGVQKFDVDNQRWALQASRSNPTGWYDNIDSAERAMKVFPSWRGHGDYRLVRRAVGAAEVV
jgi:hypothetical protein